MNRAERQRTMSLIHVEMQGNKLFLSPYGISSPQMNSTNTGSLGDGIHSTLRRGP